MITRYYVFLPVRCSRHIVLYICQTWAKYFPNGVSNTIEIKFLNSILKYKIILLLLMFSKNGSENTLSIYFLKIVRKLCIFMEKIQLWCFLCMNWSVMCLCGSVTEFAFNKFSFSNISSPRRYRSSAQ